MLRNILQVVLFSVVVLGLPPEEEHPLSSPDIATNARSTAEVTYRLPRTIIPSHYDITLDPSLEPHFNFTGEVKITAQAVEATNKIVLHANQLIIDDVKVTVENSGPVPVSGTTYEELRHFLTINLVGDLAKDSNIKININYRGFLKDDNRGFYKASYVNSKGETKWLATTQFESTDARRAFPCFDEPDLRATFQVHMKINDGMNAISNTNSISTLKANGKTTVTFDVTKKMSTYLLAFVVSDFKFVQKDTHNVYAAPDHIEDKRADYALAISQPTMKFMEEFTAIPYSFPKMTQIAIPDDWFAAGAMENWGLVTYKERYLLYKVGLSTVSEKQRIALIVAHEYGHQWFGNLVGPQWWKYIWLNEGFATYFEHFAAAAVEPELRLDEQFVTLCVQYSMETDSLNTTRAITKDAQTPAEISALFDVIAYEKAGSVIRMMEHIVTPGIFKKGLNFYLTDRGAVTNGFANEDQLYEGIDKAMPTPKLPVGPIKDVMTNWTLQEGHPVVKVSRNNETGVITLSQKRFLLDGPFEGYIDQFWKIPITWAKNTSKFDETKVDLWLTEPSKVTDITTEENEWIVLNKQQVGYYRVNYDEDLWKALISFLNSDKFETIPAVNRAQIIDDAMMFARAGELSYTVLFQLLQYISREVDYIPLYAFTKGLSYLDRMSYSLENPGFLRRFASGLLNKTYTALENADKDIEKLNRAQISYWACKLGNEKCLLEMEALLANMDKVPVVPDLQTAAYCGGMRRGNRETYDALWALYKNPKTEDLQRARIISGLACSEDKYLLNLLLSSALLMKQSEQIAVFNAMMSESDSSQEVLLDFMSMSFEKIKLPEGQIKSLLKNLAARVSKPDLVEKVKTLMASLKGSPWESTASEALVSVARNEKWVASHKTVIDKWVVDFHTPKSPGASSTFFANTALIFVGGLLTLMNML